jgi:dTDP-4-dehydrorhamnose reductase
MQARRMTRWLVTGSTGMLGRDVVSLLEARGHDVTRIARADLDLSDQEAVTDAVGGHDVVVNCAGWTAVDAAEDHEAEATAVNAGMARTLARASRAQAARLVQVSTDYVFDGAATAPYREDSEPAPMSAYGRSKAAGERAVREELPDGNLIVRTAWLYGAHGACFPRTIARVARERVCVDVVTDQLGQPTWARDVADVVERLVAADAPTGTYHATSSGQCSWFEFAQAVVAAAGLSPDVVRPVTSAQFQRPAPRPAYSVLGHDALTRIGVRPIDDWSARWAVASETVLADP